MELRLSFPVDKEWVCLYSESSNINVFEGLHYFLTCITADNPCDSNNCSQICLLNYLEDGYSCTCAEGYALLSDGQSCKGSLHMYIHIIILKLLP